MTPPLNKIQLKILNTEFYDNKNLFGRDKLFTLLKISMKMKHHQEDKSMNG